MIEAISRPASFTSPSAPVKLAMAIGVGATMPSVISMRSWAEADCTTSMKAANTATACGRRLTAARRREIENTIRSHLIVR